VLIGQYDGAAIPSGGVLGTGVLGVMPLGFELDADVIEMALDAVRRRKPAHALFASLTVLTDDTPVESVLGVGVLGTMVLGAAGSGPGSVVIDVNK
jgi:hypothetical protein